MFDPSTMIIAEAAMRDVLSARPEAPTVPERPRRDAMRRLAVAALRRLADRIEPRCVHTSAPA